MAFLDVVAASRSALTVESSLPTPFGGGSCAASAAASALPFPQKSPPRPLHLTPTPAQDPLKLYLREASPTPQPHVVLSLS